MRYFFVPVASGEADPDTLQQLPGVNADVAQTLDAEGPFATIESFLAALETTIAPRLAAFAKTDAVSTATASVSLRAAGEPRAPRS